MYVLRAHMGTDVGRMVSPVMIHTGLTIAVGIVPYAIAFILKLPYLSEGQRAYSSKCLPFTTKVAMLTEIHPRTAVSSLRRSWHSLRYAREMTN